MKTKTNLFNSILALSAAVFLAIPLAFAQQEPQNVNNVEAETAGPTSIKVTWDQAFDVEEAPVDHYRIYYGTASVQEGEAPSYDVEVDTPDNTPSYVLTDLETDTPYYISVTAIDNNDIESLEYSIETSATPTEAGEEGTEEGDTTSPSVSNVMAPDKNHVLVGFSEPVKLPELLPEATFTIAEQINPTNFLEITDARIFEEDPEGKTVILETADQTKNVNYIVTASVAITDLAGNPIVSGTTDSGLFLGSDLEPEAVAVTPDEEPSDEETDENETSAEELLNEAVEDVAEEVSEEDTTPPEDITNLILDFKESLDKFIVVMQWTPSINSAKDLVDQILYRSMDRGETYGSGTSLGPDVTSHEVPNLEGGKEYTFKITTKDAAGNESVGVVKSIRLPQTGLGIGALLIGSALTAGYGLRRRKKADIF
jgi:hypothetical protein